MRLSLPVPFVRTSYIGQQLPGERNDCAVRALMTSCSAPYADAHALLARTCGRKPGKATRTYSLERLLDSGDLLGARTSRAMPKLLRGKTGRVTLARFLAEHPSGRFYCHMRGHAFAVVDGALVDTWAVRPGSLIESAWRVEPAAGTAPVVSVPRPALLAPRSAPSAPAAPPAKYEAPSKAWRAALDRMAAALPAADRLDVKTARRALERAGQGWPAGSDPNHETRCALRRTA